MNRFCARLAGQILLATACFSLALPAMSQLRANRRPPRPEVTLPDSPARQVILDSCTQCHGIDEYGYYAMDRGRWSAVIERMKTAKSGVVEGSAISDADSEILLDWLVSEFGPDATPTPREYVIPVLTAAELLDDGQAATVLESACMDCHGLEPIAESSLDAVQWRSRLTKELSRGAALLIEDVEPLVQWLAE